MPALESELRSAIEAAHPGLQVFEFQHSERYVLVELERTDDQITRMTYENKDSGEQFDFCETKVFADNGVDPTPTAELAEADCPSTNWGSSGAGTLWGPSFDTVEVEQQLYVEIMPD